MKLNFPFRSLAALTALCALGVPVHGALPVVTPDVVWTNGTGNPIWDGTLLQDNWSTVFTVPTGTQTVIFPTAFTPSGAQDTFVGANTNGSEILLTNEAAPGGLPPTAANLIFLNSWTLTQKPGQIPGFGWGFSPLLLTQGDVTVGPGFTATINAMINVSSGELTKLGQGTLLLEQTVNGNVVVLQGTLGGNFTATGNLVNMATLSPGNSPGTIKVQGNFQQSKGANLNIEVASANSFDQLLVNGNARLGGNLNVSLLGSFLPKQGEKFTFLTAGGVSGQFENVNAPVWDLLTLRPIYGKDSVTLKAVVNSFDALPGISSNEYAVARNLNSVIDDPRATDLVNFLYGRNLNDLPKQYDKISPEELTSIFTISTSYAQVQSLNLQRRTDDIRSGSSGFNAANLAINGDVPSYSGGFNITTGVAGPSGDEGKEVKETKEVAPAENRWGAFLSGTGQWVNVDGTDNARGYELESGGFTLGVDYKVCPNFAIGLAAGYTGTTADLTDHGRVWVNGGKLGVYATTFVGGWYADAAAFGGYNSYDTRRSGIEGEARGSTDGGEVDALFGTGYDFKAGGVTFGPTATFNYTYAGMSGFTEDGSLAPLNIHGGDADSLRTAFGFKASCDCKCGGLLIKPELRAAWQHEFGDTTYSLDSSFANGAGDTFTVNGPKLGRDSALLGAGFAIQCSERCSTYLYYDGEVGRKNYESTAVTGGFRVAF